MDATLARMPRDVDRARSPTWGVTMASTEHTPPLERVLYTQLRAAYESKGYRFFDQDRYDLNIGGIRSRTRQPNRFDDNLFVAYIDSQDTPRCFVAAGTTDPGLHWLGGGAVGNQLGTAILVPGQYRRCWKFGKHRNAYEALVQAGPGVFNVWRDRDRDDLLDTDGPVHTDVTGLNMHKAGYASERVDNWSAGCQVFERTADFDWMMTLARKQQRYGVGSVFTYTLFDEADLGW